MLERKNSKNCDSSGTTRAPNLSADKEYASEVARLCLQVIMNMTYRFKEAQVRTMFVCKSYLLVVMLSTSIYQDYCRLSGGFTTILSYCATGLSACLKVIH